LTDGEGDRGGHSEATAGADAHSLRLPAGDGVRGLQAPESPS